MKINWTNSDDYYYATLEENGDKKEAIKQLILFILELSEGKNSWNLLVLDKWIDNLGRLIGHIQNNDEAIGYDRGYRVSLQFLDYYNQLNNASDDQIDYVFGCITEDLDFLIMEVIDNDESLKSQLWKYDKKNPFSIEITDQGQRIGFNLTLPDS